MIELQVDPQGTTDNYALLISCKNMVVKRIFKQNELEQHLLTEKHTIPP